MLYRFLFFQQKSHQLKLNVHLALQVLERLALTQKSPKRHHSHLLQKMTLTTLVSKHQIKNKKFNKTKLKELKVKSNQPKSLNFNKSFFKVKTKPTSKKKTQLECEEQKISLNVRFVRRDFHFHINQPFVRATKTIVKKKSNK